MTTTKATNIDGRYILFPEGGCWEYCRIRGGEVVSATSEANMGTHQAAQDHLAWLADVDFDSLPEEDDSGVIYGVLRVNDYAPNANVVVCRIVRP